MIDMTLAHQEMRDNADACRSLTFVQQDDHTYIARDDRYVYTLVIDTNRRWREFQSTYLYVRSPGHDRIVHYYCSPTIRSGLGAAYRWWAESHR